MRLSDFSFAIVQLVKKLGSTINFFFVGCSLFQFEKNMTFEFFLQKSILPAIQFAMANYMTDFGNEENSPRSSRVMRRHQIDRPNVIASEALTGCIKKCAVQGRAY